MAQEKKKKEDSPVLSIDATTEGFEDYTKKRKEKIIIVTVISTEIS